MAKKQEILYLDNSTLSSMDCSTKVMLRYILGFTTREAKAPLKAGSAGHEALAVYFKTGDKAGAIDILRQEYKEWADEEVLPDDRLSYNNVEAIQREWMERHPLNRLPFVIDPKLIEIGFSFPFGEYEGILIMFYGRMYGLVQSIEDERGYVLENKFTKRISDYWVQKFRLASQISGYISAAQEHSESEIVGSFINAIEHSKIPSSERRCSKHGLNYLECGIAHMNSRILITQRTPQELEEWRKTALNLSKKYIDLKKKFGQLEMLPKVRTQGKFYGSCGFCDFHDFCATGRRLEYVESMLVYDRWKPFNPEEEKE